jgi:DNA polymerase V
MPPKLSHTYPSRIDTLDLAAGRARTIIAIANRLLPKIFKIGYGYQKCAVKLSDIKPKSSPGQLKLFNFVNDSLPTENPSLMEVVDQISQRFPKAISIAATGFDKTWKQADRVSQRYTTGIGLG